jgi:ribosomal-protein-alanine N-acetyltransferase
MSGSDPVMPQDVTIRLRRMRWWDVEPVVAIDQTVFPRSAWTASMFWSELAACPDSRDYVVAVAGSGLDDRVVGYAGLMSVAGEATVQTIGVGPDSQRRGIGAQLLDCLLDAARLRGATEVWLEVAADNVAAQRLYDSRGFEAMSSRRDYYGPGIDAVVMRRRHRAVGA